MRKIISDNGFFNIKDTLSCGQIFRFKEYDGGYLCFSADKCAFVREEENKTVITCEENDAEYFTEYFDLKRDYRAIYTRASAEKEEIIVKSAAAGKGIRILRQNREEMLFSFIISQNNNIPRIKKIIERLCSSLGEKKTFSGEEYFTFPKAAAMSKKDLGFYYGIGLGYRAPFIKRLADDVASGFNVASLDDGKLKENLLKIYGVGEKVADCVMLFGFNKTDAFPVDTWIEKVYREDFNGTLKDRKKISEYFTDRFKEDSGFIQQYLFYYKRSLENKE